jgi:isocitrate dehydrogenase
MNAYAQIEAEKKKLEDEKAAKIVDNQYKMEVEKLKAETSLAMAEVNTKAQNEQARVKLEYDLMMKKFDMAHDAASGAAQAATQGAESEAARQHEADMQQGDQAHQATMQESQQAAAAQQQAEPKRSRSARGRTVIQAFEYQPRVWDGDIRSTAHPLRVCVRSADLVQPESAGR